MSYLYQQKVSCCVAKHWPDHLKECSLGVGPLHPGDNKTGFIFCTVYTCTVSVHLVMTQNTSAMSGMVEITSSSVSRVSLALALTLSDSNLVSSRSISSA